MANTYKHTADFAPYYDDWESAQHDDKGYVKVLFKPSVAVQARELNQTQTYLNSQIASLGGYLFKDGTPVSGAKISYVTNQKYAVATIYYDSQFKFEEIKTALLDNHKFTGDNDNVNDDINNYTLRGIPSSFSVESTLVTTDSSTGDTSQTSAITTETYPVIQITGFYEYENPNDSSDSNVAELEQTNGNTTGKRVIVLYNLYAGKFEDNQSYTFTSGSLATIRFDSIGTCTTASCTKGVIFVDGYFINVPMTTVLVNPFNELDPDYPLTSFGLKDISDDNVQYNVGFWIDRDIVTAYDDTTLTDPASGSYNYKAPGADRYKILGELCSITDEKLQNILSDVDNSGELSQIKFVTGIVLQNNVLIKEQNNVGTNSDLMDEMARRTYEESGSYSVNPWKVQIEENPTDSSSYIVSVQPGLGYVNGYRVSNVVSQKFENEKSRTLVYKKDNSKYTDASRYTESDNLFTVNQDVIDLDTKNNESIIRLINLNSCNVQNVLNSKRCLLVNRHISEMLEIRSNTQDLITNKFELIKILNPIDFCNDATYDNSTKEITFNREYSTGTETAISTTTANIVGEITVICADRNSEGLNLYVNNFNQGEDNIYVLEQAFSIISVNNNNKITGYIDLKIDADSYSSIWKNNEAPLIFETDYNYVSNATEAFSNFTLKYSSVVYVNSNSIRDAYDVSAKRITFSPPTGYSSPRDMSSIVCLSDDSGKIYNPYDYEIGPDNSDTTFNIVFKANTNVAPTTVRNFTIYYITDINFNKEKNTYLKYKTLKLATETIDKEDLTNELELQNYDLVTLLSIKKPSSNGLTEILYDSNDGLSLSSMSKFITLDTGATDYCYKKSKIKGLLDFFNEYEKTIENNSQNSSTDTKIIISYAYFEHTSGNGFYSALSYNVDPVFISHVANTTANNTIIYENGEILFASTDILKLRLYNYFGISGIYVSTTENAGNSESSDSYKIIPVYKALTGAQYNLANCIDFRPDYDANSPVLFPLIPKPSSNIEYDIALYLPRIDSVWVDKTGNFGITKGIPSEEPFAPSEIDGAMVLYHLYNRPYGKSISDIIPTYIDNKRHTMKDISKLSERVTALEEVVSMSLIEQSAINMQITDDDGITRYKCGIFTDTFSNFNNCNIGNEEWSASIDSVEKSIRPYFVTVDWSISPIGEYTMPKSSTGDSSNYISGYKLKDELSLLDVQQNTNSNISNLNVICWNNSIITLKPMNMSSVRETTLTYYDKKESPSKDWQYPSEYSYIYAKNINCTESTNVQSLMFATWSGNLTLFPSIDTWINDLGDIVSTTTYEDTEKPATIYRSWTTTTTNSFDTTETVTKASGLSVADIRKLYGSDKAATEAGKLHQRVVSKGTLVANGNGVGHWEPAETTTTIRSYETTTTTKTTETTTYTGSYIANDVTTYMEEQDAFMRVRFVEFTLKGMRPNNKVQATMDGVPLKIISASIFTTANESFKDITQLDPETIKNATNLYNSIDTDSKGEASGYILVPDKMPVGTKVVQFFDEEKLATCHADYTANGKTVWNNIDRTYVRQWTPVTTQSSKSKTSEPVFTGATRTITATEIFKEEDPIAESFYISQENGIMLEAIDIFFAAKDVSIGVELFIVECENGYPGQTIVPFSRVFVPASDVKVTSVKTIENAKIKSLPKPTTFKFPVPIYLHPKQEYAFIVIAPSYNYEIYTSTLGKVDLVSGNEIKEQPYTGSMFKSQNLRTWTAEQMQDIMFVMYSMKFNTNEKGSPVYFALDDMMSLRTIGTTTLPPSKDATNPRYDMMNLSAGTFMPNMTNIEFAYGISNTGSGNTYIEYNNKQDIFLTDAIDLYNNRNYLSTDENTFVNKDSALIIMAKLATGDENVTPQIDIEDFHGIFSRNIISTETYTIDGNNYYKAGSYISNSIVLKEPAVGLKVMFDAVLPGNSKIKVYYKLSDVVSKYYTTSPNVSTDTFMNSVVVSNNASIGNLPDNTEITALETTISSQIGLGTDNINSVNEKTCYIWYHVYDRISKTYKFIAPSQLYNMTSTSYMVSTFIPVFNKIKDDENIIIVSKVTDSNSLLDIGELDKITVNNKEISTFSYKENSAFQSYSIIGVYAISADSKMYTPSEVIDYNSNENMADIINKQYPTGTDSGDDYLFKTITCSDWKQDYSYLPGEMCIWNGHLYINASRNEISNGSYPVHSNDNMGWTEIPCLLLTKSYTQMVNDENSVLNELVTQEFKKTTERQTNFMEYVYSSLENKFDTNFFDEFMLKIELYSQNQCDVPRFRNLRAIAVV